MDIGHRAWIADAIHSQCVKYPGKVSALPGFDGASARGAPDTYRVAKRPRETPEAPTRIAPADAPGDAVERVVRHPVELIDGDIVIRRERLPILQPRAPQDPPPE